SSPPDRPRRPLGEKATHQTASRWPSKRFSSLPLCTSHRRTLRSLLPVRAWRPSGDRATHSTSSVCPLKRRPSTRASGASFGASAPFLGGGGGGSTVCFFAAGPSPPVLTAGCPGPFLCPAGGFDGSSFSLRNGSTMK